MQRGSSVNFQPITSAGLAVAHANREIAPEYLLPQDKSLGTIVLIDDKGKVASTLEAKMALASRQAKRQGDYSPLWEGVINLRSPKPGEDAKTYKSICSGVVAMWCDEYQKMTGHTVLRADIHLDEGRIDKESGEVLLNGHAHVMCDKTNALGRVLKVNAPTLRKIQDMTSEITGLKRGENSLKTGHKHIPHQQYKYLAERGRLETQQVKDTLAREIKLTTHNIKEARSAKAEVSDLKAQIANLETQYRLDREAYKASTEKKTQQEYKDLKAKHELEVTKLKKEFDDLRAEALSIINPLKTEVKTMTTKNAELAAEAQKWKAKAEHYEAEKAKGTPAHLIDTTPVGGSIQSRFAAMAMAARAQRTAAAPLPPPTRGETAMLVNEKAEVSHASLHGVAPHTPEAPKAPAAPLFSPSLGGSMLQPKKSLTELLKESYESFVAWIKGEGGRVESLQDGKNYCGKVVQLGDLHCVQRVGMGKFAIHELDKLDVDPDLDNPKTEIRYQGGFGKVHGNVPDIEPDFPVPGGRGGR